MSVTPVSHVSLPVCQLPRNVTNNRKYSKAVLVGRLIRFYREGVQVEGKKKLSQDDLLDLVAQVDRQYGEGYDRSSVSNWETGKRLAPRRFMVAFGKALGLSVQEVDEMLDLAGHSVLTQEDRTAAFLSTAQGIESRVQKIQEGIEDVRGLMESVAKPRESLTPLGVMKDALRRAAIPGIYAVTVGYILTALGLNGTGVLAVYVTVALAIAIGQGFLRWRRSNDIGELLFVSVFFILNTPLLQSTLTGLDVYGFHAIAGFAGTPIPLLLSLVANLALALAAAAIFSVCWEWQRSKKGARAPYERAVFTTLPSMLFVYVNTVLFSNTGSWIYFLIVLTVLFGALACIIALRDEEVRLSEREARFLLQAALGVTVVLVLLGIAGMVIGYLEPNLYTIGDHNLLHSWQIDWGKLGYPQEEFVERLRLGYVWMVMAVIAYMTVIVGGYLLVTVYRCGHQTPPHAARASHQVGIDSGRES